MTDLLVKTVGGELKCYIINVTTDPAIIRQPVLNPTSRFSIQEINPLILDPQPEDKLTSPQKQRYCFLIAAARKTNVVR
jgi:hypothetical protein